jgi:hypothetical protein
MDDQRPDELQDRPALLRLERRMLDAADRLIEWGTCWLDSTALSYVSERQ